MSIGASGHAVVVGAGIAGLLAARALAGRFEHVTVLDRDSLPARSGHRPGVPQGRHSNVVLPGGAAALEALLPGSTSELVAQGALAVDLLGDGRWHAGGHPLAQGASGLVGLLASRPLLEWHLRQRVTLLPGTTLRGRTSALDLVWDPGGRRVRGVEVADRDRVRSLTPVPEVIAADLVVDAGGRHSRLPEWLCRHGFPEAPEETVRLDVFCTTRTFRRDAGSLDGSSHLVVSPSPRQPRGAVAVAQEGDRWSVSLCGYRGERPPLELPGFTAAAARYAGGALADLVGAGQPLDDGACLRLASARRRRYDRMPWLPEGLVAVGGAMCSTDPVQGHGVMVAALQAVELGRCLDAGSDQVGPRFFRRTSRIVDVPWAMTRGHLPRLGGRAGDRYVQSFLAAARDDPEVATAYLRVTGLSRPPLTLLAPRLVAKVVTCR